MIKNTHTLSFTFIEILVVATIIALLTGIGAVSYTQFSKQSRDARRKADLEQIRAALEMYRSNDTNSSYPTSLSALVSDYLTTLPTDPKTGADYSYTPLPSGCDGSTTICSSYTVSTTLETTGDSYSVNPYGST